MKSKLQVGQVVFRKTAVGLVTESIVKVGKKYFDTTIVRKILIDNMRMSEWPRHYYYTSKRDYNDVVLQDKLYLKMVHCAMLSLDKLKRICAIIDEEDK